MGKVEDALMALADALGRMISFGLRLHSPVPARERVREIVSELSGIGGARSIGFGENRVRSLPDAIAKVLAKHSNFRVNGKVEDALTNGNGVHGTSNGVTKADASVETTEQVVVPNQLPLPQTASPMISTANTSLFDICPECATGSFAYEEGCKKCYSCGYSEC